MEFAPCGRCSSPLRLPWRATGEHPAIEYLAKLQAFYIQKDRSCRLMVAQVSGMIWRVSISSPDRGTGVSGVGGGHPFALRRAVRAMARSGLELQPWRLSGVARACSSRTSVGRQSPRNTMPVTSFTQQGCHFLKPLLARATAGVSMRPLRPRSGVLRVDDELHLSPLPAEDEDPEATKLRAGFGSPHR
jgi:hypothetical protein